jgi:ABC-type dipeptide/oligopeptide/nickel transport system permease component
MNKPMDPTNDMRAWLKEGLIAAHAGDRTGARRCFEAACEIDPDNIVALLWLAWLAPSRRKSLASLCRVLELDPDNKRARAGIDWLRGRLYDRDGQVTSLPKRAEAVTPATAGPVTRSRKRQALTTSLLLIAQRLAFGIVVLVSIIFLSHLGLSMAEGITFSQALGGAVGKTVAYLSQLAQGDLGLSQAGSLTLLPTPVAEIVLPTLSKSLGLLAVSLMIATLLGVSLGIWAAGRRHSGWSLPILLASIVGVSVPSFFAAMLLQLAMVKWARAFGSPLLPIGGFGWDHHIILPALVLAARPVAQIARVTFVSLGETLDQDFVRTAHSKGLRPRRVMIRHVIRNAAIPILTTIGLSLRFSLSSLPVVEFFFGWSGVGFILLKAISHQDTNLTVALALCLGLLFILVNLVLEISYGFIDPRLRDVPALVKRGRQGNPLDAIQSIVAALRDAVVYNPLRQWLKRRHTPSPSPFQAVLERNHLEFDFTPADYRAERRRAWLRETVGNLPLVAGSILVAVLVVTFVFGPRLAPLSPYTTQSLTMVDGQLKVPPFAPGEDYPWGTDVLGRDIMSLIVAGAQQTLLLAALVVLARIGVGLLLGILAGWLNGSWLDRMLLRLTEIIAAFPTLLLAMILILALGIRQGLRPFIIALCFVGWGEIMQFVRGEVLSIRARPFIESAVAIGLRTSRLVWSHVLPNLASALVSLAALEMGAVLMLLGELGFIGIFIGGGAFAELEYMGPLYHYSDVPEWGALLSNVRTYARAYPWMAIYPSLVFFITILGFNLFGEGIRRMVEGVGIGINRLVNRYTLALALLAVLSVAWVRANTGATAVYKQQASAFDGQQALAHVQALADPAMDGLALGTPGMDAAADYVAQQFQALGLQKAGEDFSYFQTRSRAYEQLDAIPELVVQDNGPALVYHQDFVEYPDGPNRNMGQAQGKVHFIAMGDLMRSGEWGNSYVVLKNRDFSDDILLVLSERDFLYLQGMTYKGMLVVAADAADLRRRYTLSARDPFWLGSAGDQNGHGTPILWVSPSTADRLLESTGYTLADLRGKAEELGQDEILELPTGVNVSMDIQGTVHDKVPARHVIGHMPGLSAELDDHLIVVLAQYDTPPPSPSGELYSAANDNASAVAVMLEAIRAMRETGYQPYKTILFVAYSGEGLEGGERVSRPEIAKLLQAKYGFSTAFDLEAVVTLRGLGAGEGNGLVISTGGSLRLADLFERSAHRVGVSTRRAEEVVDISIVFEDKSFTEGGQEAPNIRLSWDGWEATSRLPTDTLETVSADKLERAGRALSLALMILGREVQY